MDHLRLGPVSECVFDLTKPKFNLVVNADPDYKSGHEGVGFEKAFPLLGPAPPNTSFDPAPDRFDCSDASCDRQVG